LTPKRVIQKYVQDPPAEMVLAWKVHDGESVKITSAEDGLTAPRKLLAFSGQTRSRTAKSASDQSTRPRAVDTANVAKTLAATSISKGSKP